MRSGPVPRSRPGTVRLVALLAVGALVLAACGSDDDDDGAASTTTAAGGSAQTTTTPAPATGPSVVTVEAVDDGDGGGYGFDLPESVPSGPTRLVLTNSGAEPHHAQLFKLNADASVDDVGAALATGDIGNLLGVGLFDGGTGAVDPGGTSEADGVVDLATGTYVFMCFIENAQGPHVAQGMLQPFTVTSASANAAEPTTEGDVELVDYGFDLPDDVSGSDALAVTNGSAMEVHEMNILRPGDGAGVDEVLAFFEAEGGPSGPPPFSGVGGLQAIMPGASQTLQLGLDPGRYILICLIPSPTDGVPHAAKGMIQEVTIS